MESELTRYFIFLSYRGTSYHGWQAQPNSVTVQSVIEDALSKTLSEKITVTGAGRTDTGVHARYFCAHFDSINSDLDSRKNFVFRLNRFLPADISVDSLRRVKEGANARFSAISRTYRYYISTVKDPFTQDSSWFLHGEIDITAMNAAADILKEYTDFTSFSRLHADTKTNNCKIMAAEWTRNQGMIIFTIKADRFLRNMVRAIVGTMVETGFGRISNEDFRAIIEKQDRCSAGKSAPAKGLFLENIEYPEDIFI